MTCECGYNGRYASHQSRHEKRCPVHMRANPQCYSEEEIRVAEERARNKAGA